MLFTENLSRAHRVAARLQVGTVWVNCFFIRDLRAPFGGVGDSGVGREGGSFSREFFTEPKAVVVQVDALPAERGILQSRCSATSDASGRPNRRSHA
jgi:aminomuconate-semialdehyde/2-hydroxymuconate-6-semialdehyde dehydrogenase